MKYGLSVLLFLLVSWYPAMGIGTPLSWTLKAKHQQHIAVDAIDIDAFNQQNLAKSKMQGLRPGPKIIARIMEHHLDIGNDSAWQRHDDQWLWKASFSTQSLPIVLNFTDSFFPSGSTVYIYDTSSGEMLATLDEGRNRQDRNIWTHPLYTRNFTIEVNSPVSVKSALELQLRHVAQGGLRDKNDTRNDSGACNEDIACAAGDEWFDEQRSVVKTSYPTVTDDNRPAIALCTGSLINNTDEDGRPLILTAAHCDFTANNAAQTMFQWQFQRSVCNTANTDQAAVVQQGAAVLASWEGLGDTDTGSDFALLLLDTVPPSNADVYYSGWDRSTAAPTSVIGIHHPQGDVKKICVENQPLTIDSYVGRGDTTNYLRVDDWDEGVTESGSSGSAIWNANGHIVGTLSGGSAACARGAPTIDNNQPDWYGRFASHWTGNGTTATRLSDHLDPLGSNATTLDGKNACTQPTASITSPASTALNTGITFTAEASGGSGNLSFAWDFDHDNIVDATTASGSYTYTASFQGNIVLTVTDDSGCTTRAIKAITAGDPVTPDTGGGDSGGDSGGGGGGTLAFYHALILLALLRQRWPAAQRARRQNAVKQRR